MVRPKLSPEEKAKSLAKLKEYYREYYRRPEVIARKKIYYNTYRSKPENRLKIKEARRRYYAKPEVKARINETKRKWFSKPENKAKLRAYMKTYLSSWWERHPDKYLVHCQKMREYGRKINNYKGRPKKRKYANNVKNIIKKDGKWQTS